MNDRVVKNPNFKSEREFHRSLAARGVGAKNFPNSHTEVEYLGGGKFGASLSVGHRVFFDKADGNKPKKHKLTDERPSKDYILIQSAKCAVEVYPYYAKYFDVQHEEVRLHEERWVVQRLFKAPDDWRDVDAYNPVISVEEYSEPAGDVVTVTITYDTDYGILIVEYFQRDNNALKHNVTFKNTSGGEKTFRVLQRWAGIVGAKCNSKDLPVDVDEPFLAFHRVGKPQREFAIAENLWSMIFNPDGSEKTEKCLQRPVSVETHAQGMKADFIYGNWVLAQGGVLEIDPATATLSDPTEDGESDKHLPADGYTCCTNISTLVFGVAWAVYGIDTCRGSSCLARSYVEWDVSSILDGSTVTVLKFLYHGNINSLSTDDGYIHAMANQPSANGCIPIYDDCGDGAAYVSGKVFPEVGAGKEIDLGAQARTDLEGALAAGWFAIGFSTDETEMDEVGIIFSEEYGPADPKPTLYVEYTPPIVAPTVTTQAATNVQATTATGNGNITNTGGENCDKRGIVYGLTSRGDPGAAAPPGGYDAFEEQAGSFGTGPFTRNLTGLSTGRTYYARAYAHNSAGYNYGGEVSFLTKPAAPVIIGATENQPDKVVVTWNKSTGATGYQVYRDGVPLGWLGDVATYDDVGADAPTITPGAADASDGTYYTHVALSLAGEAANNGTTHTYKVRAKNATGESGDSGTDTGYRLVGALTYQWQRSAADSDAAYDDILGATTDPYNDTGAPENGDGRYYQCVLNATGATEQTSSSDRGYRAVAGLENKSAGMAAKMMGAGLI